MTGSSVHRAPGRRVGDAHIDSYLRIEVIVSHCLLSEPESSQVCQGTPGSLVYRQDKAHSQHGPGVSGYSGCSGCAVADGPF
jgi:hypothetical protein